jgi:glutamate formiminotransferase
MAVEVPREDALERTVVERKPQRVALDERRLRHLVLGHSEHALALVEPGHLPRQMLRQVAGAAGDVECPPGRECREGLEEPVTLGLPLRANTVGELAPAEVPVVVLGCAAVVVLLHHSYSRRVLPLESVPNFSEGRDQATIHALADVFERSVYLLDVHADADHNRSVFTVVGHERELARALVEAVAVAVERIDLRNHEGAHPRIGAADVVPVVPIDPDHWEKAARVAGEVAERIGSELGLPVFVYAPPEVGPAHFRRGGPERLQARIDEGELAPDFGPARLHPTAGAVIVGVRNPLIAFNVNLSGDLRVAREIAAVVREHGGGFPGVRALGLDLPSVGLVQVSMNVEDWEAAALHEIVERVAAEAEARGAEVVGSELVGLMPAGAAAAAAGAALRIDGFDSSHVLELRLLDSD